MAAEAFRAMPQDKDGKGARVNRAVLGRAVRFMASEGIDQFLDLGSGLPTVQNTHEIAQATPTRRPAWLTPTTTRPLRSWATSASPGRSWCAAWDVKLSSLDKPALTM